MPSTTPEPDTKLLSADPTVNLTMELIRRRSITPADAGCQDLIAETLVAAGWRRTDLPFGQVSNVWLSHGQGRPLLLLLGHTDVVPPGPPEEWHSDPFIPTIRDGCLYGRGAADMKGGVAAMVTALERYTRDRPDHNGTVALLLTSDEEGEARDGVRRAADWLQQNDLAPDYCLIGEPSSTKELGDTIRHGRRGSLTAWLSVTGRQGHVAYPEKAINPLHTVLPALNELIGIRWDEGDGDFPPTGLQLVYMAGGDEQVHNVIPGTLQVVFNLRYNPAHSAATIQQRVEAVLQRHGVTHHIRWKNNSVPFISRGDRLRQATIKAVQEETGRTSRSDTGGGTSDGRFIAPLGAEIVELGLLNHSVHQVNEHVSINDLPVLAAIYQRILHSMLDDAA